MTRHNATGLGLADLFGQGDDDASWAAEVTEQEDALVLCHLAEEFGAVGAQAGDGVMDVDACPGGPNYRPWKRGSRLSTKA